MQMESWKTRRNPAAEALAAEGVMEQWSQPYQSGKQDHGEHSAPSPATIGFVMAVALSLPFWMVLALLLYLRR